MTMPQKRYPHACPECSAVFWPDDIRRRFCSPEHKRAWENRQTGRGQGLVILAQAWRQGRNKKGNVAAKWALNEFANLLDQMTRDDKASGRMPALMVLEARLKSEGLLGL